MSIDTLLRDLASPQWEKRVTTIRVLACQGHEAPPAVIDAFRVSLKDISSAVRAAAVQALEGRGLPQTLLQLRHDPSWEVRTSVIQAWKTLAMDSLEDKLRNRIQEAIISALQEDGVPTVRRAAVNVLARLGLPEIPLALFGALEDEDASVRQEAIWALKM
ncbi:HEAT repeat domain-containing protein [Ktedonospora formicarum]|uniref:HEAT repeat domain-containing protein n=1 Tax=Ktedonospora formicarum TaxID=2778364 RepID=A0A8J3I3P9_9CHLR|nr:HEAT repeat domain-containing protein [Ktedonospora formicarum]GHO46996.1 hypothetical protein KSX_51590 [Ktedonospora formicarum]